MKVNVYNDVQNFLASREAADLAGKIIQLKKFNDEMAEFDLQMKDLNTKISNIMWQKKTLASKIQTMAQDICDISLGGTT